MIADELILHNDYENFANYLGIDYEDYLELIGDYEFPAKMVDELDYSLSY